MLQTAPAGALLLVATGLLDIPPKDTARELRRSAAQHQERARELRRQAESLSRQISSGVVPDSRRNRKKLASIAGMSLTALVHAWADRRRSRQLPQADDSPDDVERDRTALLLEVQRLTSRAQASAEPARRPQPVG